MIKLRPHHLICILFFKGKGYSKEFTQNMESIIKHIKNNSKIKIVIGSDDICNKCPNKIGNYCKDNIKVTDFDKKTLSLCEINNIENEFIYSNLKSEILNKIIFPGKRVEICNNCQWNNFCNDIENEIIKKYNR